MLEYVADVDVDELNKDELIFMLPFSPAISNFK